MLFKREQHCLSCHFFVQQERIKGTDDTAFLDVKHSHREAAQKNDFSWVQLPTRLACYFGVWDEGFRSDTRNRHQIICSEDRNDFCFWWRYRPGMLLPAAKVLQERESNQREAARDRRLTIWGLWVAAIALAADVWLRLAEKLKFWPFC